MASDGSLERKNETSPTFMTSRMADRRGNTSIQPALLTDTLGVCAHLPVNNTAHTCNCRSDRSVDELWDMNFHFIRFHFSVSALNL